MTAPPPTPSEPSRRVLLPLPRLRTVIGGAALAGVLLSGLTLAGGAATVPGPTPEPWEEQEGVGPLTAIQPELQPALATEPEQPAPAPSPEPWPALGLPVVPAPVEPSPVPLVPEDPVESEADDPLCRALLSDPAGLAELLGTEPVELTPEPPADPEADQGVLHHVFALLDVDRAEPAYARLREVAAGCHRVTTALADGEVVTVLLEELGGERAESALVDESYRARIRPEDPTRPAYGWLSIDRVGRAVSVLHHLGPEPTERADQRDQALSRLRELLRSLGERTLLVRAGGSRAQPG